MSVASPRACAGRGEAPLVLALTTLLTIVSLVPPGRYAAAGGVAAIALTIVAWKRRAPASSSFGLLLVTCLALALVGIRPQQVMFALAFAVYAVVASRVRWFRKAADWFIPGRLSRRMIAAAVGVAGVSAATLLSWYLTARPDLTDLVPKFVADWPLSVLLPAGLVFSLINAAVEEAAYRGVVLGALDTARVTPAASLVLQAVAFAALHFQAGFPRGLFGVGLTFAYGLVLGQLRRHSGGLIAPFITHVLTDLAIVTIVLVLVRT